MCSPWQSWDTQNLLSAKSPVQALPPALCRLWTCLRRLWEHSGLASSVLAHEDQSDQAAHTQDTGQGPGEQGTTLSTAPEHPAELLSGSSSWNPVPQLELQAVSVKQLSGVEEEIGAE